ncbi:androglobin-like, partial [Leptonychotes weddellii]|uniref:Androglobin-like n=1 Tax=Leptonychotes weddellii TaxID=9713 RepID=A0A7F8R0A3_LEPWE
HGEKHEELVTLGSPDSHTISEGQKSSGTSKTTRKGKEKSLEKDKTAKEKQAPRFEPQISTVHPQQEDPNKPYWILRLVTEHNEAEFFEVKKDTERADEIRAMKQAWEMTEPGRAIKASQARLRYLSRFIKKIPDAESMPVSDSQAKVLEEVEMSSSATKESDTKGSMSSESKDVIPSGSMLWKKWQMGKGLKDLSKSGSSESGGMSPAGKEEQSVRKEIRPRSRSPTILETSPRLIRKALECVNLTQYVRKTIDNDPVLQTEELNKQQAMQKAEEVHQFRQYRTRVLSIRDIDQEEQLKVKDEILEMYGEMRGNVTGPEVYLTVMRASHDWGKVNKSSRGKRKKEEKGCARVNKGFVTAVPLSADTISREITQTRAASKRKKEKPRKIKDGVDADWTTEIHKDEVGTYRKFTSEIGRQQRILQEVKAH